MSLEIEGQHGQNQQAEGSHGLEKKLKMSYTRDFLLSLSELDVCKRLPSGFDELLLSEFEDTSQDRFRTSGSLSSQSFTRNEYGSSPPSRGDISNYSRVSHGRWDSRSSGKSDWDSDSQSDRDSESGRRYGNQPRRSWQVPEHDGLLGSGSFPRPSGYAMGSSVPKFRATNDHYQLNKSNEPYHPPRPYKAVPHSRRDTKDSYNDETFGSSECTSEDRAEEERKRRASFELMRKEQQKAFEGNQKLNPEKCKNEFDISLLAEDSGEDKRLLNAENESNELVGQPVSNNDSDRSPFLSSAPVSRPVVPPGFSGAMPGKNIGMKPPNHSRPSELGNEQEGGILHAKVSSTLNRTSNIQEEKQCLEQTDLLEQQLGSPSLNVSVNEKSEKVPSLLSALDVSSEKTTADRFFSASNFPEAFKVLENSEVVEPDARDVAGNKLAGESAPVNSTSILEKLFSSALTLNGGGSSTLIEHDDTEADVSVSPRAVQSSKFAQWFLQEDKQDKQPVDGLSSFSRPNDLLSLIVGGQKGGSQHFGANASEQIPANLPFQSSELAERHMTSNIMSTYLETTERYCSTDKSDVPSVLTCEDLEQSFMSEIPENRSSFLPPVQGWSNTATKAEHRKVDVDDLASQHLLSLLQKGSSLNDTALYHNPDVRSPNPQNTEVTSLRTILNSREAGGENVPHSGKPLTLEALFGTAFMKELQPVGTIASSQKDLAGSAGVDVSGSHGLSLPVIDDDHISSTVETGVSVPSFGSTVLAPNQRHQVKSDTFEKRLLGFDPREQGDSSQLQSELSSKFTGFDKSLEVRLPEEDSLIAASDPLNVLNYMPPRNSAKAEFLSIQDTPVDSAEKLSALSSVIRDEGPPIGAQEGPFFLRGLYSERESNVQHHNLHVQTSSPQLRPQLNHTGPMFHPLDSHLANINAQMKFMSQGDMIRHDNPNHQFPTNMLRPPFHHPIAGMAGLDPTINNPLLQQMHMHGNISPHHLRHGFPGGVNLPSHLSNQVTGFMQGPSLMQGPHQRQSDFGDFGFPPQGGGTNHPEALQRLIEMELRSKSKQVHPFPTAGRSPGIYGHELDMGFGYR